MANPRTRLPAPGLYETPVSEELAGLLRELGVDRIQDRPLSPDEAPEVLARAIYERLIHSFASLYEEGSAEKQVSLANGLIKVLSENVPDGGARSTDRLIQPGTLLLAVRHEPEGTLGQTSIPERPLIPLSVSTLLTNARTEASIGSEIQRELESADRADLICSFLKWNGLRVILDPLRSFLARRPHGLRVITTTYMGATERKALDVLHSLGADLKVSYETGRTRLHAKAWLLSRESGFTTAFIGSSNLSRTALLDGLEWNVRLSATDNRPIVQKFGAAFEQYWAESEFETYDPDRDGKRFDAAVRTERKGGSLVSLWAAVDLTPRPHQQTVLDALQVERNNGHCKNLVVAATGTGKTVIAALDYRRLCKPREPRPSLLFVAHREEILQQAQDTFRIALRDPGFGEKLVGGTTPIDGRHVFASIQSLHEARLRDLRPDAYHVLVVDEFHHAAAASYKRLLSHLKPAILLGLTATPERADGESILGFFDNRIASELRLWRALDEQLLSPFQYFGSQGPSLGHIEWKRGRYDSRQLSNLLTGDHVFVRKAIQEIEQKTADVESMRALAFCVDVAHAEFVASELNRAEIVAESVSGSTDTDDRRGALARLSSGDTKVVCSVDLFNEGVDLPDVNTIILLRPTESATLFLQQLGRGLRRSPDKDCCTVFDFIGDANRKFRFDLRFRAIIGGTRRYVERQVEQGFPYLPSGCSIVLDRDSQRAVLDNIRHQLGKGQKGLIEDLRGLGASVDLREFLDATGFDLEDVYESPGCTFSRLRREAGFANYDDSPDRRTIERSLARLLHIDDAYRLDGFLALLSPPQIPAADSSDPLQRMLFMLLGNHHRPLSSLEESWRSLWRYEDLRSELVSVLRILRDRTRRLVRRLPAVLEQIPLLIHATYSQDEVMAALNQTTSKGTIRRLQQGVLYAEAHSLDAFFVTLEKSERDYTPTTLYRDYPISPSRFHWESQSSCHEGTPTGARYLEITRGSGQHAILFVRQRKRGERGETTPYLLLGPVFYAGHRGGRPMQIEWELMHSMPEQDFQEMKVAAG